MNFLEKQRFSLSVLDYLKVISITFPILLIVFIPRPPISGSQYLIFPTIVFFAAIFLSIPIIQDRDIQIKAETKLILLVLLFQSLVVVMSQTFNSGAIRTSGAITIFRPFLLMLLLLLGVTLSQNTRKYKLHKALYLTGVIILFGQLLISIAQVLYIPIFDLIYSSEKSRGFGQILRVTGSLSNPNIFGLIITQSSLLVLLFGKKKSKYAWLVLAFILIIFSGSRSQLLIYPFVLGLALLVNRPNIDFKSILKIFSIVVIGFVVLIGVVYIYSDTFRYLYQLFTLLEGFDLDSISSFSKRFDMWERGWHVFFQDASTMKWFIGLGSIQIFQVADNDYFYTIWHYGLIGLTIHIALYLSMFTSILKSRDRKIKALCLSSLAMLFVLGFQVETMSAWLQPLTLFYFFGLALGVTNTNRVHLKN